jgi:GH43 family beta-xylosidase
MTENIDHISHKTFLNPVYPNSFPDPFVLKFRGLYYAFCTGIWHDGRAFGVLRSPDLVHWTEVGGAMERPDSDAPYYWAPEVTYFNGKFYLYYSVGNETLMELRVAVSDRPDGGFIDSGRRLTGEDFAIDAHLFFDSNGEKYLFYATDFLEHTHIGTGTVVDRMIDFFTLEGRPRPVTRARYDWQVYDPQRKEKGGVRWHTVEGPFVLKRKGVYYQMFSGGNWQNPTYGVSFAVTDDLAKDEEWLQFSDGLKVLPILRTLEGKVVGPGHNSVVRGPNNRELFCVYHRWTEAGRVLAIDRMDFAGGARMFIRGATVTPQLAPFAPKVLDHFDEFSEKIWETLAGRWETLDGQMVSDVSERAELACRERAESFLLETSLRLFEDAAGRFGVGLRDAGGLILRLYFEPAGKRFAAVWTDGGAEKAEFIPLAEDFDFSVFHLLRVEADHRALKISLDERETFFKTNLPRSIQQFSFIAENCRAAFSGAALTLGFEDLFETGDLEARGWRKISGRDDEPLFEPFGADLKVNGRGPEETVFVKKVPGRDYEFAVNFRLPEFSGENARFGFYPVFDENEDAPFVSLERAGRKWALKIETRERSESFELNENFSPDRFHQLRFLKIGGRLAVGLETDELAGIDVPETGSAVAFAVRGAAAVFDMLRVTVL